MLRTHKVVVPNKSDSASPFTFSKRQVQTISGPIEIEQTVIENDFLKIITE